MHRGSEEAVLGWRSRLSPRVSVPGVSPCFAALCPASCVRGSSLARVTDRCRTTEVREPAGGQRLRSHGNATVGSD